MPYSMHVSSNITLWPAEIEPLPTALSPNRPLLAESYTQGAKQEPDEGEKDTPQRVWQVVPTAERPSAPAWVVGSIVHEALAQWRFPDADQVFERWGTARGREFGLTSQAQLKDGVNRAKILLNRFKSSEIYTEITTASRRLPELPYTLGDDEGVIDLLVEVDNKWTIYDFKTDQIRSGDDQKRVVEGYKGQLERYKAAVTKLVGQVPDVKLVLLNGDGGVTMIKL